MKRYPIPRRQRRKPINNFRFSGVTYDTPAQMATALGYSPSTVKKWLRAGYTYMGQVERANHQHRQRRNSR